MPDGTVLSRLDRDPVGRGAGVESEGKNANVERRFGDGN